MADLKSQEKRNTPDEYADMLIWLHREVKRQSLLRAIAKLPKGVTIDQISSIRT